MNCLLENCLRTKYPFFASFYKILLLKASCQRERTCHSRRASISVSTKMSKLPFRIRVSLFARALNRASCKENTQPWEKRWMKGNPIEWSMLLRRIIEGKREKGREKTVLRLTLSSRKIHALFE